MTRNSFGTIARNFNAATSEWRGMKKDVQLYLNLKRFGYITDTFNINWKLIKLEVNRMKLFKSTSEVTKKELRQFGLLIGIFIILFFGFLIPWIWGAAFQTWPWIAATVFIGSSVLFPIILKPIYILWMKFSILLGWVNTRILLAIVFYVIVMPTGMLMRLFGKDPLNRKLDHRVPSYYIKSKQPSIENLEKPF